MFACGGRVCVLGPERREGEERRPFLLKRNRCDGSGVAEAGDRVAMVRRRMQVCRKEGKLLQSHITLDTKIEIKRASIRYRRVVCLHRGRQRPRPGSGVEMAAPIGSKATAITGAKTAC